MGGPRRPRLHQQPAARLFGPDRAKRVNVPIVTWPTGVDTFGTSIVASILPNIFGSLRDTFDASLVRLLLGKTLLDTRTHTHTLEPLEHYNSFTAQRKMQWDIKLISSMIQMIKH